MTRAELAKRLRAKLAASGLTATDARALGFAVRVAGQVARLGPEFPARGGVVLPYHRVDGRATGFYRVRFLEDPAAGWAALAAKPRRYQQPAGTAPAAYFPRLKGVPWERLARDPQEPLLVTEGELKAACATKLGFPTVGLGGVYAWRSAKRGEALIPDLAALAWEGREVFVAFDADVAVKPEVRRALTHLCAELTARGARPRVVSLPLVGDKGGLDDFLVERGAAALRERLEAAEPFAAAAALWEFNTEVAYVRDPGLVVDLASGQRLAPRAFTEHAFANRFFVEQKVLRDGEIKLTEKPLAKTWLQWPHRHELRRITYKPGAPRVTVERELNAWPGWGVEPAPGDVAPWGELLARVFPAAEARTWFERWVAIQFQQPGVKLLTAVLVWSTTEGTGKSMIGVLLGRLFGENFAEIGHEHLTSVYNEWAFAKQFVLGDELIGPDRRGDAERMKRLVTQRSIRINQKYVPSFAIPDCINYYLTSNHSDALYLAETDRRFFVHEAPTEPLDERWLGRYDRWLAAGGAAHLFAHLLEVDLAGFDPNQRAPMTEAKQEMIEMNRSDVEAWLLAFAADPESVTKATRASDLWTSAQLRALYDPDDRRRLTDAGMGRAMRRVGFRRLGIARTATAGVVSLWAVRNADGWIGRQHGEWVEHFERYFGGGARGKF